MNNFEKIFLSVLVIFGITVFILFIIQGGSISDSIFPELVGFSLEGIILVILFGLIQRRYNKENELKQKEELKETLLTQIDIFLFWSNLIPKEEFRSDGKFSFKENSKLENLIKNLKDENKLFESAIALHFIKIFSKRQLPNIVALLPVSANINSLHLKNWSIIINNINGIIESDTDKKSFDALIDFLVSIKIFNETKI
ncbi:hypothetical protein [Aliarcobacter cryaerophilus]|uniref:Uncharacterized protein n=3 Tax=unclassified Arcobacter TaxID=2593671 RepID=A0AA96DU83_9BACT|nr:hypothetical protein RMQ65_00450 [Arcobacter sp. AZ-2023]WPD04999.1 hypothetical protein QUR76_07645 [Arcobacter sp. DSM 115956]WPD07093.1 hypothetical protein QUR78_07640 [Arcobacter sp. DSM 115955]WNL28946.1 hypothetical protein RMQ68_06130 [Arcobacter sp. AZ-2023]WNL31358.1 hypothetical protein RMQ67_07640 [Arcobacter sp. AZ-2023]